MAWVRLADDFADHPKILAAGPLAGWLWVCGLAYANKHLTDGLLPAGVVRRLADLDDPARLATRLVEVGLWERAEDGYRIHDYAKFQPSAEAVRLEREQAAERQREWRKRLKSGGESGRSNGVTSGVSSASPVPAVNPDPYPVPAGTPSPLPPSPQAGQGERSDSGRRRGRGVGGETPAPAASSPEVIPLAPLSPADVAVWGLALDRIRSDVTPANADLVARLEPLGRAGDGGLRLRAPPGQQLGRFSRLVAVALTGAGDAAGNHAAIVETG